MLGENTKNPKGVSQTSRQAFRVILIGAHTLLYNSARYTYALQQAITIILFRFKSKRRLNNITKAFG